MTTEKDGPPGESSGAKQGQAWRQLGVASGKALRVLVVDDDEDVTAAICLMLETFGYRAEAVHNADEVSLAVERFVPQILLVDIGLPGRSGFEVALELQAHQRRTEMRIIALTGSADEPSAGALFDRWLIKPVSTEELLRALRAI